MKGTTVFLVDDEPALLKALTRLLSSEGYLVRAFTKPEEFVAEYEPGSPACLVLDVALPGVNGLEFHEQLRNRGVMLPIVFLTGHGDIPMSVRAIRAGAVDFLTKPVDDSALLRAIRSALKVASEELASRAELATFQNRLAQLTPRERQVLEHVIAGKLNKQIAADLGTGEQNIKVHRGRVMEKLGIGSLAELVRVADRLGVSPANPS